MRRRAAVLILLALAACSPSAERTPGESVSPLLVDRTADTGLDFVHENGARGRYYYVEIMSGGGALIDFDRDGDLDLYAVQGQALEDIEGIDGPIRDRFYRNEGPTGEGGAPRFVDITDAIGLDVRGFGVGAATGDVDGDGWPDLYVTRLGRDVLLRNIGGERFEDVSEVAGLVGDELSSSAAFADLDADGDLDLFVSHYLRYDLRGDKPCTDMVGLREYCGPQSYFPERDRLYRNRGDGTFEDVTTAAGIDRDGSGLGVVTGNFDRDGRLDIYVAKDQAPNHLWRNQGDFRFREEAMERGAAVDHQGKAEASMGVAAADLDRDGDEDLFMTHLIGETNTLYRNDGVGYFDDASLGTTFGRRSLRWTGFGCSIADFDADGWLDLFVANGSVRADPELRARGESYPYQEPDLLFLHDGAEGFVDATDRLVSAGTRVGRGTAEGDLDNDGDTDIVVFNANGPARILLNTSDGKNAWIGLRIALPNGADALGAEVKLIGAEGHTQFRRVATATSYVSARDPRLRFGLGAIDSNPSPTESTGDVTVEVTWIDGQRELFSGLAIRRYHEIVRGTGRASSSAAAGADEAAEP